MAIESDRAEALSGIRHGVSTGAPIALMIPNKDWENWQRTMYVEPEQPAGASGIDRPVVTRPRPGHADLAGVVKYGHDDIRNVLERASARETAARVAVGAIARQLLRQLGTDIVSHVVSIGSVSLPDSLALTYEDVRAIGGDTPLHCADAGVEQEMIAEIDRARDAGRHHGRQLRGHRARRAARARQLRAVGSQARRTARAGDDVHSRDQGGRRLTGPLFRYAPEKWSIRRVLNHVNDTERLFVFRAFWFARGFDSALPAFDQDAGSAAAGADGVSWARHVEEFRAIRAATVSFFGNLPAEAWTRRGIASDNPVSVRALAYITAGHLQHHMAVLRERYAAASPRDELSGDTESPR